MNKEQFQFDYAVYEASEDLSAEDGQLLSAARSATELAYAPYSNFQVGAAARLANGEIIVGGNLENASFPAGLCAEGVVLASAASRFPGMGILSLAVSYRSSIGDDDKPITPCGICRQSIEEFSVRTATPVRLILGGQRGKIMVIEKASSLLPLAFKF